jgi:hypothetical protein
MANDERDIEATEAQGETADEHAEESTRTDDEQRKDYWSMTGAERWDDDVREWEAMVSGEHPDSDGGTPRELVAGFDEMQLGAAHLASLVADVNMRGGLEHIAERSRRFLEEMRDGGGVRLYDLIDRVGELEEDLDAVPTELIPGPVHRRRTGEHEAAVAAARAYEASEARALLGEVYRDGEKLAAEAVVAAGNVDPSNDPHAHGLADVTHDDIGEALGLAARTCAIVDAMADDDDGRADETTEALVDELRKKLPAIAMAQRLCALIYDRLEAVRESRGKCPPGSDCPCAAEPDAE